MKTLKELCDTVDHFAVVVKNDRDISAIADYMENNEIKSSYTNTHNLINYGARSLRFYHGRLDGHLQVGKSGYKNLSWNLEEFVIYEDFSLDDDADFEIGDPFDII